ncbi:hypothetical protein YC2023_043933 [Brassica napus]
MPMLEDLFRSVQEKGNGSLSLSSVSLRTFERSRGAVVPSLTPALLLVVRAPLAELSGVLSGDETLMVVRALSRAVSVRIRWWSPVKVLDDRVAVVWFPRK